MQEKEFKKEGETQKKKDQLFQDGKDKRCHKTILNLIMYVYFDCKNLDPPHCPQYNI